ncbi:MAG: GNAT family N-acetyltransferase [Smithellaceae bacterium]
MKINTDDIVFEPAGPEQAADAARLMYETGTHLWDCFFKNDFACTLRFLEDQWRNKCGLYSYSKAAAATIGGKLIGIEVGYDLQQQDQSMADTIQQARTTLTSEEFKYYAEMAGYLRYFSPPLPGKAYYIMFLATHIDFRKKGVGGKLLNNAFDRAAERGYRACHLDADADNPAVSFYQHRGMEILSESRVLPLEKQGVGKHYRMIRQIKK